MSGRDLTCGACGLWFRQDSRKGPVQLWCGRNCKQRAYRLRTGNRSQQAYRARTAARWAETQREGT